MAQALTQKTSFRDNLVKLEPPQDVLDAVDEPRELAESIESEDRLEDLLRNACRRSDRTKPWAAKGTMLTCRAKKLSVRHPEYKPDRGGKHAPPDEQACRRGYVTIPDGTPALPACATMEGAGRDLSKAGEPVSERAREVRRAF